MPENTTTASSSLQLSEEQKKAIESCISDKKIVGVTGKAGTGKTTIIRYAYNALVEAGYRVALASPTGKAAKRLYEVTGIESQTLHRLLEYTAPGDIDPDTGKVEQISYPKRNINNRLEHDYVLVDEYSMVSWELHDNLVRAMKHGGRLRVFGDINQLQPVEKDEPPRSNPKQQNRTPFRYLLENWPKEVLTNVYRSGDGILMNLSAILDKRWPTANPQWVMKFTDKPVQELERIVRQEAALGHDYSSNDCQIITTDNRSLIGTVALNRVLQPMFIEETKPWRRIPRWSRRAGELIDAKFYVGDKVICTSNIYGIDLMNGEGGRIVEFGSSGEIVIDVGDRIVVVPSSMDVVNRYGRIITIDPRKYIELAYAITTHKSQGSEYNRVIYILNKANWFMHSRQNFYTAASRAKSMVTIISDQRSFKGSILRGES